VRVTRVREGGREGGGLPPGEGDDAAAAREERGEKERVCRCVARVLCRPRASGPQRNLNLYAPSRLFWRETTIAGSHASLLALSVPTSAATSTSPSAATSASPARWLLLLQLLHRLEQCLLSISQPAKLGWVQYLHHVDGLRQDRQGFVGCIQCAASVIHSREWSAG